MQNNKIKAKREDRHKDESLDATSQSDNHKPRAIFAFLVDLKLHKCPIARSIAGTSLSELFFEQFLSVQEKLVEKDAQVQQR